MACRMDEVGTATSTVGSDVSKGTDSPQPAAESMDQTWPALPDDVRQHLVRLLASAYEHSSPEPDATGRFADLLARLEATLDEASRRDAAEFQAELLAMTPALRRFAMSLVRDRSGADDLVQDTLLRAWRARASFQSGTNFEAWTFTIMRNQFYTSQRKSRPEVQDEDGAQAARLASPPEQGGHLDLADVQAALARLAPSMREALVLVAIENLSYDEAAAVLNCRIGTVKSRVWRAREQLARMLGYDGSEVGSDAVLLSAMESSG
jgi:RNA polymerase sigma-70 factor (ECF subfamily)